MRRPVPNQTVIFDLSWGYVLGNFRKTQTIRMPFISKGSGLKLKTGTTVFTSKLLL